MNSLGTNRLHYIHSGNIAAKVGGQDLMLEEGHLYIFPQNLKFELFPNNGVWVDHTFYDFWTIPAIKSDNTNRISVGLPAHQLCTCAAFFSERKICNVSDYQKKQVL